MVDKRLQKMLQDCFYHNSKGFAKYQEGLVKVDVCPQGSVIFVNVSSSFVAGKKKKKGQYNRDVEYPRKGVRIFSLKEFYVP